LRDVVLELPGFLELGAIIKSTDLIATLPRHIGEALAKLNELAVHPCPVPVDGCAVSWCSCSAARAEPAFRVFSECVLVAPRKIG